MPVSKEGLTNSSNQQNLMQESGGKGETILTFLLYLIQLMQRLYVGYWIVVGEKKVSIQQGRPYLQFKNPSYFS